MGGISEVTPGPKMLMPSLWKFAKIQKFSVGEKKFFGGSKATQKLYLKSVLF